jgi:hypothetical protein
MFFLSWPAFIRTVQTSYTYETLSER